MKNVVQGGRRKAVAIAIGIAVLAALPHIVTSGYWMRVIDMIIVYSIIAVSINLIGGYCGELAMGHACYAGVGAYTTAILATQYGMPFHVTFPASIALATAYGFLTAIVCVGRIRGDYVMIVTMGVSEITRIFFVNAGSLTGGPMGVPQVPGVALFGHELKSGADYYYLLLALLAVTIVVIRNLVSSKFGRTIVAIREDKVAAQAMGIRVDRSKIIAFGISTAFAGMAGAMLAHFNRFVGPMQFSLDESLLYYQMIIVGGLGSIPGSVLGAGIFVMIPEVFRGVAEYRVVVYGLIMVVMMIARPGGILGDGAMGHIAVRVGGMARAAGAKMLARRKGGAGSVL